jgi:hypothetical protein
MGIEGLAYMAKDALGVGLAAGGIAAGVQLATDAISVLALKRNHQDLLVKSLFTSTGLGRLEGWMMRQIGLGNRGHVDQLAIWGEQIKQGMFPKEFIKNNYKSVVKTIMSSYDAMAGLQAVKLLGSKKVKISLIEKEGGGSDYLGITDQDIKEGKGGYLNTIIQAFYTGQKMINDLMTPEQRNEFLKNFKERMRIKTMKRTAAAILTRGASQIIKVGPWALGASLLSGIYHGVGLDKILSTKLKAVGGSGLSEFFNKYRHFGAPVTPNVLPDIPPKGALFAV